MRILCCTSRCELSSAGHELGTSLAIRVWSGRFVRHIIMDCSVRKISAKYNCDSADNGVFH